MGNWLSEKNLDGSGETEEDGGFQGCRGARRGGECRLREHLTRRMEDALGVGFTNMVVDIPSVIR